VTGPITDNAVTSVIGQLPGDVVAALIEALMRGSLSSERGVVGFMVLHWPIRNWVQKSVYLEPRNAYLEGKNV
jgi:hypothetical protein